MASKTGKSSRRQSTLDAAPEPQPSTSAGLEGDASNFHDSSHPSYQDVVVEYVKENYFPPQPMRTYHKRSKFKVITPQGKGYSKTREIVNRRKSQNSKTGAIHWRLYQARGVPLTCVRRWEREFDLKGETTCTIMGCSLRFLSLASIRQHWIWCAGRRSDGVKCEHCMGMFANAHFLEVHREACKNKFKMCQGHACDRCGVKFASKRNVITHKVHCGLSSYHDIKTETEVDEPKEPDGGVQTSDAGSVTEASQDNSDDDIFSAQSESTATSDLDLTLDLHDNTESMDSHLSLDTMNSEMPDIESMVRKPRIKVRQARRKSRTPVLVLKAKRKRCISPVMEDSPGEEDDVLEQTSVLKGLQLSEKTSNRIKVDIPYVKLETISPLTLSSASPVRKSRSGRTIKTTWKVTQSIVEQYKRSNEDTEVSPSPVVPLKATRCKTRASRAFSRALGGQDSPARSLNNNMSSDSYPADNEADDSTLSFTQILPINGVVTDLPDCSADSPQPTDLSDPLKAWAVGDQDASPDQEVSFNLSHLNTEEKTADLNEKGEATAQIEVTPKGKAKGKGTKVTVDLTCVRCGKLLLSESSLKHHLAKEHQLVYNRNCPEGVDDPAQLLKVMGRINCPKCGKEVRYMHYYRFHVMWCGREDEMVECEICHHPARAMYYNHHKRMHVKAQASSRQAKGQSSENQTQCEDQRPEPAKNDKIQFSSTGRERRAAAKKALKTIQERETLVEKIKYDKDSNVYVQKYSTPSARQITREMRKEWAQKISEGKKLVCKFETCNHSTSTVSSYVYHVQNCLKAPESIGTYRCLKCGETIIQERMMHKHVAAGCEALLSSKMEETGNVEMGNVSDEGEYTQSDTDFEADELSTEEEELEEDVDYHNVENSRLGTPIKGDGLLFENMVQWNLSFLRSADQGPLFRVWRPRKRAWKPLTGKDLQPYIPQYDRSPAFEIQQNQRPSSSQGSTLGLFKAMKDGSLVVNAGGPVWALDWCPTPLGSSANQYLAVYSHNSMSNSHLMTETFSGPSLIQIWDCGIKEGSEPVLSLGIAHEGGAVWRLKWCPLGCWQEPVPGSFTSVSSFCARLGVLAAACSDGVIYIYSVPHPGQMKHENPAMPIFRVEAEATLRIQAMDKRALDEESPCLSLDWQITDGCSRVFAGFANGSVHIWDLNTESFLLRSEQADSMEVIRPYLSFRAHLDGVTGVAVCQKQPSVIATTSWDRHLKLWDTSNTESPVGYFQRSIMTDVIWPYHWPLVYVASDDCYQLEHNSSALIELGYYNINLRPLSIHNSSVWGIANSNWLNAICGVDSSGDVMVVPLPYLAMLGKNTRSFTARRQVLFTSSVEPTTNAEPVRCSCRFTHQSNNNADNTQRCSRCREEQPVDELNRPIIGRVSSMEANNAGLLVIPSKSNPCESGDGDGEVAMETDTEDMRKIPLRKAEDVHSRCKLVYKDTASSQLFVPGQKRLAFPSQMTPDQVNSFPLQANHRACWNPNLGWHTWLALGGQAGLVRLFNLTSLDSKASRTAVAEVFKQNSTHESTS